ncbi:hypothetical protein NDN01_04830 [Sphingomonas sp. QA11]|uniref:hypothetical protein n=1 Tax=Sphingomonas sp. QA11 TaxID=2950605 RepID=UPI002349C972|nr:hypothetical protein [Sphingomonas sp. QA11]WCM28251.1 hypothetical protein NDN01_04830 [Sphingomonas sp. QA11]
MTDHETRYLLTRAKQEATMAARAEHPSAAAAHRTLSLRYSTKAVIGLSEETDRAPVDLTVR